MRNKYLFKRCCLLVFGLLIMAYGVSFSITAGLGTSPISSLPYTLSQITPLSVGMATIVMHCILILLQILLLRHDYRPVQLLQLPIALLFGSLTDLTLMSLQYITPGNYIEQWICCLFGIVLVGIGVSCEVKADVVPLAGEGLILAICQAFSRLFAPSKICFDVSLVTISAILGLIFQGQLIGVREGTVAAALLVGLVARQTTKWLMDPLTRQMTGQTIHP